MLIQFSVSNYRSFRKRQTLNLAASSQDKMLPGNCIEKELPGVKPRQWLRGVALYGANASGKTTVILALKALTDMVASSARMTDPKDPIPQIEPFALSPGEKPEPTAFAVVFVAEGIRYEYRVAATRERVWHESLRAFPNAKAQVWFARDWNPELEKYEWTPETPSGFTRDPQLEGYTLGNMLFLSKAIASNRTELEPVFRWFKERVKFLHLGVGWHLDVSFTLQQLKEKTPLAEAVLAMLCHADLGVTGAQVVEKTRPKEVLELLAQHAPAELQRKEWEPQLLHRGAAAEVPLPWDVESTGTQRFFALVAPWLDILSKGTVVCIDELETSMHPTMVMELLQLFFDEKVNVNGAQLIFTTHNPLLLDITLMRRDQVWLTDKDKGGEGHLYPLTDYAPRKGESLIRGYMSGRYGAVPFLSKGLLGQKPSYEVIKQEETPEEAGEMKTKRKVKPVKLPEMQS